MTRLTSQAAPAIGIDDIAVATTSLVVRLEDLANATGVEPDKYRIGIGQDEFSMPAEDEDTVTLAAAAAAPIIARADASRIRTVLVATESGVDQSKSAAVFVHALLGLPEHCRAVELKQACYGGTAALTAAAGIVARDPEQQVLVIASDVAHYAIASTGEPTQGAAAVAMLVSASPRILKLDAADGVATIDTDDFWRPNDATTPVVNGHRSIRAYVRAVLSAWDDYRARGGADIPEIAGFCYHQPFTRMAEKAHQRLLAHAAEPNDRETVRAALAPTMAYNRRLGNSYTASVYSALASLLDASAREDSGVGDLGGRRVALASYGSGSVAEVLSGVVVDGYRERLDPARVPALLDRRRAIDLDEYRRLHALVGRGGAQDFETEPRQDADFRFAGVRGGHRVYTRG